MSIPPVAITSVMPIAAIPSDTVDPHGRGYPRPQLQRTAWYSLNGPWDFALDPDGDGSMDDAVSGGGTKWTGHQIWWSCEYGSLNHYDMKMKGVCNDGGATGCP